MPVAVAHPEIWISDGERHQDRCRQRMLGITYRILEYRALPVQTSWQTVTKYKNSSDLVLAEWTCRSGRGHQTNGQCGDTRKVDYEGRKLIRNLVTNFPTYIQRECEELRIDGDIVI
jgi:hypothetical protein